jgi:hypothetical protein
MASCHLVGRQRRAEDLADRSVLGARAAQRQLVEFLALLIDAQDADVATWWWPQALMQPLILIFSSPTFSA